MLLSRLRSALACTFFALATTALAQTTINVGPNQPYSTIQSGMDAAHNGDTVLVAPGTYTENINFNGKAITVTSSGGAAVTMITGGKQAATVTFANGETRNSVLSNLTITGGGDGTSLGTQGGISIVLARPTISGDVISEAGCYGIGSQAGAPLVQNNTISRTQGNASNNNCGDGNGSGIWLSGYTNPYGNYPLPPQQPPQILHNLIENNTYIVGGADTPGGAAIAVRNGTTPYIAYNTLRYNSMQGSLTGGGAGGGIHVFAAGATIANNLIYANSAIDGGGGISIVNFGTLSSAVTLINNTLYDNGTLSVGVPFFGGEQLAFSGSYPVNLFNNLLIGDHSRPAMVCFEVPSTSNSSAPLPVIFANNDLFNSGGPLTGGFNGSSCNYPANSNGNLETDPLFVDALHADFHLAQTSPAIDAGSKASLSALNLTTDLDNNPRIQNATGHGCIVDIGAYEYPGNQGLCGTITATLQSSANPSTFNQTVTFTAQLSSQNGTPTGSVQFTDGNTVLGTETLSATGIATFTTTQLSVGTHTITATYQPTGNFPPTSTSLKQVVNGYATTTQLTSSPNPANVLQGVTFIASVASGNGAPDGSITFADGGTTLAVVPLASGTAAYSTAALAAGSHQITATYTASGPYAASAATITQTVIGLPTSTTVGLSPNPATAFGTLTLISNVSAAAGTPSGTVSFSSNGIKLGSASLNAGGQASLTVAAPLPGAYSITAVYSGNATYNTSTSAPAIETVIPTASATALTASPNPAYQAQTVTLSAVVTGRPGQIPTGSVTFADGSTTLGTGTLSATGAASLTVNTLAPGTHTLTATYQAAGAYVGSSSAPLRETILPGSFGIALSPSTVTLGPGNHGTVQVALSSIDGFSGPLTLSFGAMPTYANATINPGSVTLTAGGSGAANLVLNASLAQLEPSSVPGPGRSAAVLAAITMLLIPARRKRRKGLNNLLGLFLLAALLTGASGCGILRIPFQTAAPGTYHVPVTATNSNGISQTAILTLTVTP